MRNTAHSRRYPVLALALVVGMAIVTAAVPAYASESAAELQPQALVRAKSIRTHVNARYRRLPGRKLAVTEVTSMGVVDSVSLITDPLDAARVLPAENGIYFALCSVEAKCPHPARWAAWPAAAFRPRRQALELAVRAFEQTAATVVVVALPTWSPTWLVFERTELLEQVGAPLRNQLSADPRFADAGLRGVVERLTRERTFLPLGIEEVAPGHETFIAITLFERSGK
jgi:hypothetical protein